MGDVTPGTDLVLGPYDLVPLDLLRSDRFLDRVLDRLEDAADMDIPCGRGDLKAALLGTIEEAKLSGEAGGLLDG